MKEKEQIAFLTLLLSLTIIGVIIFRTSTSVNSTYLLSGSPLFPYIVGIITFLLIGIGYLILDRFHFQKLE